jgi:hypothetical protein
VAACVDACLEAEPQLRPSLTELRRELQGALPSLDGTRSVPVSLGHESSEQGVGWLRVAQLAALTAWGVAVTLVAAVLGRPGLALVLGALTAPAILVASRLAWSSVPGVAPFLGAVSAASVYPAVAGSRGTALERGVMGALGWCWLLVAAATVGMGSGFGLIDPAPAGWSRSTAEAASGLLAPLLAPEALLGAAVFAFAAVALGVILRVGHVALALLGALLWAAGLEAGLQLVAEGGGLTDRPLLIAAAAVVAVILEFRHRPPEPADQAAPVPRTRAAIQGEGWGAVP